MALTCVLLSNGGTTHINKFAITIACMEFTTNESARQAGGMVAVVSQQSIDDYKTPR